MRWDGGNQHEGLKKKKKKVSGRGGYFREMSPRMKLRAENSGPLGVVALVAFYGMQQV